MEEPLAQLAARDGAIPSPSQVYDAMIALKDQDGFREGTTWTNFEPYGSKGNLGSAYKWNGGAIYGANSGVGCMAFAFILSDEAFGNLPARPIKKGSFSFEDVKVGDILRVNGNSHSVIVIQKGAGGVTVAEGNYNKSVHWGRAMNPTQVENADFIITRYPEGYNVPSDSETDEIVENGTAGKLSWSLTSAGVLTISGNGVIPDYSSDNTPPWNEKDFNTIVIEEGVTGIGNYAFYQSSALSVYIPDGVKAIGESAFRESSLLAVTIPGTVTTIGNSAFHSCTNLTSATVSEGVAEIGDFAFQGCKALAYIDFPASIISVGSGAFMACEEMVSVRFMPSNNTAKLGDALFMQCGKLQSVTLPQTADCISNSMFSSCWALPELYIPKSVKSIDENSFDACNFLKIIRFGGSQSEWNSIVTLRLKYSLQANGTQVIYDVPFDDPFAKDPDDPGDFQPDDSGDETNPSDPEKPSNPENPSDPENPGNPENPSDPEKPGNPENPSDPEKPGNPENPSDPEKPGNPENPSDPEKPSNPEKPGNNSLGTPSRRPSSSSSGNGSVGSSRNTSSNTSQWVSENTGNEKGTGWKLKSDNGAYITGTITTDADGNVKEQVAWAQVNGSWYAFGADGYADSGWVKDEAGEGWYYVDINSGMQTGWHNDINDEATYFMDIISGKMLTGWNLIEGKWYYFNEIANTSTWQRDELTGEWVYTGSEALPFGAMFKNTTTPDGYIVDENGVWIG